MQERVGISPPAWGWPVFQLAAHVERTDFPTRVGMARLPGCQRSHCQRFPHPRGDGPFVLRPMTGLSLISPPAWGWPATRRASTAADRDFPTRVGMARRPRRLTIPLKRFPHPRGDGPRRDFVFGPLLKISPPAWGWPATGTGYVINPKDFPTRVGMARMDMGWHHGDTGFPHPRGDGPGIARIPVCQTRISPPAWGWPVTEPWV